MFADFLMLAKFVEQNEDQTVNIMGGNITNIAADEVPVLVPYLFVVTRVTLEAEDHEKPHEMTLQILMPNGEALTEDVALRKFTPPPVAEGMIAAFVFSVQLLNCAFPMFGRYQITLIIDGNAIKTAIFRIGRPDQDPTRADLPAAPVLVTMKGEGNG